MADMQIGQIILNRYRVIDIIGGGGQSLVAKAQDLTTGQLVAVKQLTAPRDKYFAENLARFQRAAQIRINHPAVVDPMDFGQENGEYYMVMPHIDGLDLDQLVLQQGCGLPPSDCQEIIRQTAEGLGAIHAQGITHRDIKPHNIIRSPDGRAHLIDLGICRIASEYSVVAHRGPIGTYAWMAPEQVLRPHEELPIADLYSLGAVLYWLLMGTAPVAPGDPDRVQAQVVSYTPPPPRQMDPAIPAHLDANRDTQGGRRSQDRREEPQLVGEVPEPFRRQGHQDPASYAGQDDRQATGCRSGTKSSSYSCRARQSLRAALDPASQRTPGRVRTGSQEQRGH